MMHGGKNIKLYECLQNRTIAFLRLHFERQHGGKILKRGGGKSERKCVSVSVSVSGEQSSFNSFIQLKC